jgi:hypothetical protein
MNPKEPARARRLRSWWRKITHAPHKHFEFCVPADFLLTDDEKRELRDCVECRSRFWTRFRTAVRYVARVLPPEVLEIYERVAAEEDALDPHRREEKEWRDADKGTPQ